MNAFEVSEYASGSILIMDRILRIRTSRILMPDPGLVWQLWLLYQARLKGIEH